MQKQLLKDSLGWGILLWLIGYLLGMVLFFVIPPSLIGWVISPIASVFTIWLLIKKIKGKTFSYYFLLAIVWILLAIILDYLFIVKLLKPTDGYYKLDVYLYYLLTLVLPLIVGWWKTKKVATYKT